MWPFGPKPLGRGAHPLWWGALLLSLSTAAAAAEATKVPAPAPLDLRTSFQAALSEDARYQAARAALDAGREALPMAQAQLRPQISANLTHMHNDLRTRSLDMLGRERVSDAQYSSQNYVLSLRQAIYRPALRAGVQRAQAQVQSSEASFERAAQDLALRVIGAYFNALLAEEGLRQVQAQQRAIEGQLAASRLALQAGAGTRTDIDDAQARLDMNRARLLGARQQIDQARHELQVLVNRPVDSLLPLEPQRLDMQALQPALLSHWSERAERASPELRDLRARVEAARHEIARARAGHRPTLDLIVQRSWSANDNVANPNQRFDNSQIGVQLVVPLYGGGLVGAQVRQMQAALVEAQQLEDAARRQLGAQVRQEFQGVQEGMLRVQALTQAELSAGQAVSSNTMGVLAGTRTRIDILNAEEARSNVQLDLMRARLEFAMSYARLLALSGALDEAAIATMNRWLAAETATTS